MSDMKKLAVVLAIIYFIVISGSVVYSMISDHLTATVKSGNLEKLERQLQTNKDTDEVFKALYSAIYNQNVNAVKILLNYVNIGNLDRKYDNPLFLAIQTGNKDIVNLLLDKGADINAVYYSQTTIQKALSEHKYSIASMLIERGADLSKADLAFALVKGELEKADRATLVRLVKIAAENTDIKKSDIIGTFFGVAVYTKNYELLDFLNEKYKDASYLNSALRISLINSDTKMADYIATKGGSLEDEKIGDTVALVLDKSTTDTLKHIIDNYDSADNKIGIDVVKQSLWIDRLDLASYVLERGIDVNRLNSTGDDAPIFTAILKCNPEAVKLLLDHNVPIDIKNSDGKNVFEALEDVRKSVDWLDFGNKQKLDDIYKMLKSTVGKLKY